MLLTSYYYSQIFISSLVSTPIADSDDEQTRRFLPQRQHRTSNFDVPPHFSEQLRDISNDINIIKSQLRIAQVTTIRNQMNQNRSCDLLPLDSSQLTHNPNYIMTPIMKYPSERIDVVRGMEPLAEQMTSLRDTLSQVLIQFGQTLFDKLSEQMNLNSNYLEINYQNQLEPQPQYYIHLPELQPQITLPQIRPQIKIPDFKHEIVLLQMKAQINLPEISPDIHLPSIIIPQLQPIINNVMAAPEPPIIQNHVHVLQPSDTIQNHLERPIVNCEVKTLNVINQLTLPETSVVNNIVLPTSQVTSVNNILPSDNSKLQQLLQSMPLKNKCPQDIGIQEKPSTKDSYSQTSWIISPTDDRGGRREINIVVRPRNVIKIPSKNIRPQLNPQLLRTKKKYRPKAANHRLSQAVVQTSRTEMAKSTLEERTHVVNAYQNALRGNAKYDNLGERQNCQKVEGEFLGKLQKRKISIFDAWKHVYETMYQTIDQFASILFKIEKQKSTRFPQSNDL